VISKLILQVDFAVAAFGSVICGKIMAENDFSQVSPCQLTYVEIGTINIQSAHYEDPAQWRRSQVEPEGKHSLFRMSWPYGFLL